MDLTIEPSPRIITCRNSHAIQLAEDLPANGAGATGVNLFPEIEPANG